MFEEMRKALHRLDGTTLEIYAQGEYPTKARTEVQKVAKWQNDGTEKIKPARFVERAYGRHRGWAGPINKAAIDYLFRDGNFEQVLQDVGLKISYDINVMVNRIKTGRLKASMRPRIVETSSGQGSYYLK